VNACFWFVTGKDFLTGINLILITPFLSMEEGGLGSSN